MAQNSFDLAVVEMASRLPAYFRRRISNHAVVDDLTQETLVKAFRSRGSLRRETALEPWLYRIAYCTIVDYYRQRSDVDALCDELPHTETTEQNDVRAVLVCSARCYLETLPKSYRDPVHLAEYEDVPHAEIARTLGLSLAATKSRIRRGKKIVRDLMEARCRFEYDAFGNIIGYEVRASPRETVPGR